MRRRPNGARRCGSAHRDLAHHHHLAAAHVAGIGLDHEVAGGSGRRDAGAIIEIRLLRQCAAFQTGSSGRWGCEKARLCTGI